MTKNKKIKFGLLGLGNVVRGRVKNIFANELKNSSVEAVFDKDKKKVKEYSKYFRCSETFKENLFFKKNFKICYISTPSGSHFNDILKCFKYNKHVVVEKPPVLKIKQLIFLNKLAKKKKLNFFVIYQNSAVVLTAPPFNLKIVKEKIICKSRSKKIINFDGYLKTTLLQLFS